MRSVIWVLNMFAVFGSPATPGNNQAAFERREPAAADGHRPTDAYKFTAHGLS